MEADSQLRLILFTWPHESSDNVKYTVSMFPGGGAVLLDVRRLGVEFRG